VERPEVPLPVAGVADSEVEMRFAIMDTETTGLDPEKSAILEICIVVLEGGQRVDRFHTRIKPTERDLELAQARALEINGYAKRPELWNDAPHFEQVAEKIAATLDGCIPVGHNVAFDLGMLRANYRRHGFSGRVPYPAVDTLTLVAEHLWPLGLRSASLGSVRSFLGWSSIGAHTAVQDVEDTLALFRLLWRATWWTRARIRVWRWFGWRVAV
jgi:DNA polymerase III alpha subunit (gram-positive type)